jgi:hypothetical protein
MALNTYKVLGQQTSGTYETFPITTAAVTSNVATVTTGADHGLSDGDLVDINGCSITALNIRVPVTVASATTFTFPVTNGNTSSAQTSAYVNVYKNGLGNTVTNKEKSSGYATLTTGSDHGLEVGNWITVEINDAEFDGDFEITSIPSTTTLTYVKVGSNVASSAVSNGAVSANNAINLYTAGSEKSAVCSTLSVSNTLDHTCYFSAYTVLSTDSKTNPPAKSMIANRIVLDAGETYSMTMGYTVGTGESFIVKGSHGGMNFNIYGTELS